MRGTLSLLALDPLPLVIGVFLTVMAIASFLRRAEVAERLARSYTQQPSPSWAPTILRKRFGIRETRVISLLISTLMLAVGFQQLIAAFT